MSRIQMCDVVGHKYADQGSRDHGCCERCHGYTSLELMSAYGDAPWWMLLLPTHLMDFVKHTCYAIICRIRGHKWADHGYATPNTGCIHMECERCGIGYRHVLY